MANVVIDIAAEFTGNKAFKNAQKSTNSLEKSVKKLAKQFLALYSTQKLISFAKESAKAFAADQKSVNALNVALANTGNAFKSAEVKSFIADLEKTYGVIDDNLRPAFQTLVTATGDVTKSEKALNLALDIAAGTGRDLQSVSIALAKGYSGQTTALGRLGAGLSKATLKSGDMEKITAELTSKFKGQALSAAQGYAGQMDKLAVASENAKEIIGKDLLDTLSKIAGKDGIGGATTAMEDFATQIGNVIVGIGVLVNKLKSIPGFSALSGALKASMEYSPIGLLAKLGAKSKKTTAGLVPMQSPAQRALAVKEAALLKQKIALGNLDNANTAAKIKMTAGQQALDELKKIFDIQNIELHAALNGTLTKEEEARVKGLIAINNSDGALAIQALSALNAAAATDKMTAAMTASLASWGKFQSDIGAGFQAAAIQQQQQQQVIPPAPSYTPAPYAPGDIPGLSGTRGFSMASAPASVNIQINPAVAGLIDVIQNQSASGISPTVSRINSSYIA